MRLWVLTLLAASTAAAADEQQLALELRAQTDFERVQSAVTPDLAAATRCVQSEAAVLAVAGPAEQPLHRYRKGYCAMAGGDFGGAAAEFDKAIAAWSASPRKQPDDEPVSPALLALDGIARLKAGTGDPDEPEKTIVGALAHPSCTSALMSVQACEADLKTAREWLGWIDFGRKNLTAAAREFSQGSNTGWQKWIASQQAFENRQYAQSASDGKAAVAEWDRQQREAAPSFNERIRPQPEMGPVLTDLGGAELLAGEAQTAIATLDRAVKTAPQIARAYYLRGRAKEETGQAEDAAVADYNLASRTAFAGAKDLNSGEAHLYRGIVDYRRKEFLRAEDEFSSALNFNISPSLRADAAAWRYLAAVAGGSCEASRGALARALPAASPFFPKREASAAMNACPATIASSNEK